ncbi:ELWxxDGT repeat protein [Pyxidicoccus trucidator]|uniref:ELWxxDGT repeat protein n=1 Tax=Pyxidicoccus trucidator TaxID=2709662 RepID=UPI0013DD5267|nr:ELWxxDGT repeat protein [Pyxidicoccus trucidator]
MMNHWRPLPLLLALFTGCAPTVDDEPGPHAEDTALSTPSRREWEPCGSTPRLLSDIRPGPADSFIHSQVHGEGVLFFAAHDGTHSSELWRSSGLGGTGTFMVRDIAVGLDSSGPTDLTMVGDRLFFIADDEVRGRALWASDGTEEGTYLVERVLPIDASFGEGQTLVAYKGRLYFSTVVPDGTDGYELWTSDGTEAGTFMVEDFAPGPASSFPRRFIVHDGFLYFVVTVDDENWLVRSDGGPGFTPVLKVFEDTVIFSMKSVGRKLFFLVDPDEGEADLYVTDGTAAGTRFLRFFPGEYPHDMVGLHGKLYFSAGSGAPEGEELWVSDGTRSGTKRVKDIQPGAVGSAPAFLAVSEGRIFFAADDGEHGRELWVSDGTTRGTVLFRDLEPGATGSSPSEVTAIQDWLFFGATTAGRGAEPWVSDGTVAGTRALDEVAPGAASSSPRDFIRSGWDVFFTAEDGSTGRELYALPFRPEDRCAPALQAVSDGTAESRPLRTLPTSGARAP